MSIFKIGMIVLMLPLRPLTEGNWLVLGAIIAIIILIIYLAYSYVFKQKAKAQKQLKEKQNEADQTRD